MGEGWRNYRKSFRYAFYVILHPFDGFWDLTHEKRGTMAAANTILFLTLLVRVLKLRYTSFVILTVYWEGLNIFLYIGALCSGMIWDILLNPTFSGLRKGRIPSPCARRMSRW